VGPELGELGDDADTNSMFVFITPGVAATAANETCDCMLRLLATSDLPSVDIQGGHNGELSPLFGAALSLFFQESESCLREITLNVP
jgi:hypothetical protein